MFSLAESPVPTSPTASPSLSLLPNRSSVFEVPQTSFSPPAPHPTLQMIGFLQPTSGTALIEGLDIRQDMDAIYGIMGVCPQHE